MKHISHVCYILQTSLLFTAPYAAMLPFLICKVTNNIHKYLNSKEYHQKDGIKSEKSNNRDISIVLGTVPQKTG